MPLDTATARPALARKVRLQRDRLTGRTLLLYPERGLVLNESATQIAMLCDGSLSVDAIVDHLARGRAEQRELISRDVLAFLNSIAERGLVEWV